MAWFQIIVDHLRAVVTRRIREIKESFGISKCGCASLQQKLEPMAKREFERKEGVSTSRDTVDANGNVERTEVMPGKGIREMTL